MVQCASVETLLDPELTTSVTLGSNLEWHGESVDQMDSGLEKLQLACVSQISS